MEVNNNRPLSSDSSNTEQKTSDKVDILTKIAIDTLGAGDLDATIEKAEEMLYESFKRKVTNEVKEKGNKGNIEYSVKTDKEIIGLINEEMERSPVHLVNMIGQSLEHKGANLKFCKEVLVQMSQSTPNENEMQILKDILKVGPDQMEEILKGAHVRVDDNGALYEKWSQLKGARVRISSHPSVKDSKQYGIDGPWVHELLFGVVEENGKMKTFFQLENTPWSSGMKNRVGHSVDAIQYVMTNKNKGPYGSSFHTDKQPIRLSPTDLV